MKAKRNEFNAKKGQALKERGMAKAAAKDRAWLPLARAFAIRYARKHGEVTSDIVQKYWPRPSNIHPNVTGSLFRGSGLVHTGRYVLSKRVAAHRRAIAIYRYVGSM
jgi:hypothetical protein